MLLIALTLKTGVIVLNTAILAAGIGLGWVKTSEEKENDTINHSR